MFLRLCTHYFPLHKELIAFLFLFLRANVIKEIGKLVESPDRKFVVHCLYSECKNDLALETAMKVCQDKPALIFVKCGDKISAESCVPEVFMRIPI